MRPPIAPAAAARLLAHLPHLDHPPIHQYGTFIKLTVTPPSPCSQPSVSPQCNPPKSALQIITISRPCIVPSTHLSVTTSHPRPSSLAPPSIDSLLQPANAADAPHPIRIGLGTPGARCHALHGGDQGHHHLHPIDDQPMTAHPSTHSITSRRSSARLPLANCVRRLDVARFPGQSLLYVARAPLHPVCSAGLSSTFWLHRLTMLWHGMTVC